MNNCHYLPLLAELFCVFFFLNKEKKISLCKFTWIVAEVYIKTVKHGQKAASSTDVVNTASSMVRPNRGGEVQLGGAVYQEPPECPSIRWHHTGLQGHLGWGCSRESAQVPLPRHPKRRRFRKALQQRTKQRHEPKELFLLLLFVGLRTSALCIVLCMYWNLLIWFQFNHTSRRCWSPSQCGKFPYLYIFFPRDSGMEINCNLKSLLHNYT